MLKVQRLALSLLFVAVSLPSMADSAHHPEESAVKAAAPVSADTPTMPMTGGQGSGMPMMRGQGNMPMMAGQDGMPMMEMMQQRHAVMDAHMKVMETHMANIEALLRELVALQQQ